MFEAYTEKARRVIFYARLEASEFGSPLIESEFLLLGILREEPYAVTLWLGGENVIADLREEIVKCFPKKESIATSVDLPLSNEAKRVLGYAAEEAKRLAHQHIGVEHLFLALLREPKSRCGQLLQLLGIQADAVREMMTKESVPTAPRGVGSGAGTRHVRAPGASQAIPQEMPQVSIVLQESGESIQLTWTARLPHAGDLLSLDRGKGETVAYRVTGVEWKVIADATAPPSLSQVVIKIRELGDREST